MASILMRIKLEKKLGNAFVKRGMFVAHKGGQALGFGTTIGNALHDVSIVKDGKIDGLSISPATDKLTDYKWEIGAPRTFILWHDVGMTEAEHNEIVRIVDLNKNKSDAELEKEFDLSEPAV